MLGVVVVGGGVASVSYACAHSHITTAAASAAFAAFIVIDTDYIDTTTYMIVLLHSQCLNNTLHVRKDDVTEQTTTKLIEV